MTDYSDEQAASGIQKVFFFYDELDFRMLTDFVANPYEFMLFRPQKIVQQLKETEEHLFMTVFRFWMPYWIFASLCYIGICSVIINYIARNMTQ